MHPLDHSGLTRRLILELGPTVGLLAAIVCKAGCLAASVALGLHLSHLHMDLIC